LTKSFQGLSPALRVERRVLVLEVPEVKRLFVMLVLAAALLGVLAAPALAAFPATGSPGTAYVHPWAGTDPIIWEQVDAAGNWYMWSVAPPSADQAVWAPYKAIPSGYDICMAAWMTGWPKAQVALWPVTTRVDCVLYGPTGGPLWSVTPREARGRWGPVIYGWDAPTIYQENAKIWMIGWTYPLGKLPPGTYWGSGNFTFLVPYLNFELGYRSQMLPQVIAAGQWNAANPYSYRFTIQ
jgi:hypothetical protein